MISGQKPEIHHVVKLGGLMPRSEVSVHNTSCTALQAAMLHVRRKSTSTRWDPSTKLQCPRVQEQWKLPVF